MHTQCRGLLNMLSQESGVNMIYVSNCFLLNLVLINLSRFRPLLLQEEDEFILVLKKAFILFEL